MVRRGLVGWLVAVVLTLTFASPSTAAPYEPNDSILAAAGPLVIGQTYEAALDTASDRDFFYFYVTSRSASIVSPTIRNLGSGDRAASLNAAIVDSLGSPLDAFAYFLGAGGQATAGGSLIPQKYFLEVRSATEGTNTTTYSITPGGGKGAFGPYSAIASRCASGTTAVETAQRQLRRAQARLQRASARLRQALYLSATERHRARLGFRDARTKVREKREALKDARKLLRPWCSIPQ
jgi:hypothetical protein